MLERGSIKSDEGVEANRLSGCCFHSLVGDGKTNLFIYYRERSIAQADSTG
jgi:hypothetical protein